MAAKRDLSKLDPQSRKAEEDWKAEAAWPLFEVEITGDDAVYAPRADERFFEPITDPETGETRWQAKGGKEVIRPARARVQLHAVNADLAKARALAVNPGYHTVESCKELKAK